MKMQRRILVLFLCMCMFATHLPISAFAGGAQPQNGDIVISEIKVNIEIPLLNSTDTAVQYSVGAGETGYTVKTYQSDVWRDGGGWEVSEFTDQNYAALFRVIPEAGYVLSPNAVVYVNNSTENVNLLGDSLNPASYFEFWSYPKTLGTTYNVDLTNVPADTIGESYLFENTVEHYKVTGTWQKYDYATKAYVNMAASETSEEGNIYRLRLYIEMENGYLLSDDCTMTVNGEEAHFNCESSFGEYYIYKSCADEIEEITINPDELPKAVVGESFSNTSIPVTEGSNYMVTGYWMADTPGGVVYEGTFENGKEYYFVLNITPKTGAALSDDLMLHIGDEEEWMYVDNLTSAEHRIRTSFKTVINEVELIDLPEAVVGGKLQKGYFDVKVPEDAKYTAEASWWVLADDGYEEITTDTVENGKVYRIDVEIYPKEGYEFASPIILKANGIKEKITNNSEQSIYYDRDISFRSQISKIEIIGVTEPVAGQVPSVVGLKVPDGANYTIQNATWEDADTYESVSVFEDGHAYGLNLKLVAKNGYEFAEDVVAFIENKEVYLSVYDTNAYVSEYYSLKEVIPEIKISNIPQFKVGSTAGTKVEVPKAANYTANVFWYVWNDAKEKYSDFAGTFESGKIYRMLVRVVPKNGYCFDEDQTVFYVDGKQNSHANVYVFDADYRQEYFTEVKTIDRVEITIAEPVVGHHSSINPNISIAGGANYKVVDDGLGAYWITGSVNNVRDFEGYFKSNQNYGVGLTFLADEGYIFSEDVIVVINGKVIPSEATWNKSIRLSYFFGMGTEETEPDKSETNRNDTPSTGDEFNVNLWTGMAMISGIVMLGYGMFLFRKKRF